MENPDEVRVIIGCTRDYRDHEGTEDSILHPGICLETPGVKSQDHSRTVPE
jgi:hypothetical protein